MGNWKAVRPQKDAPLELYDLARDPDERHDVAAANPEVLKRITAYRHRPHRQREVADQVTRPDRPGVFRCSRRLADAILRK